MKLIAQNKRAFHDYLVEDKYEAGIVLLGSEVKSIRLGKCSIGESYVDYEGEELYWYNGYISEYEFSTLSKHGERRPRKLLLSRREINKLIGLIQRKGYTVIPIKLYINTRNRVKLEIATARGKKKQDKREALKKAEWERDKARVLKSTHNKI